MSFTKVLKPLTTSEEHNVLFVVLGGFLAVFQCWAFPILL